MPKKDNFITTQIAKAEPGSDFNLEAVSYVMSRLDYFQAARLEREDTWLECWAMYFANPRADLELRKRVYETLGDVKNDWRHRINTGKAFEQVETILSHLMAAFFPNRDWFEAVPANPGYQELSNMIKKYTQVKLRDANFVSHWQMFIRQMCVTGSSVIALPWRKETTKFKKKVKVMKPVYNPDGTLNPNGKVKWEEKTEDKIIQNQPDFETLDMFDCYFDPTAISVNDSDFVRRLIRTKAEMADLIRAGFYDNISVYDVVCAKPYNGADQSATERQVLKRFEGISVEQGYSWTDHVEVWEYWGDITINGTTYRDVVATIHNDKLIRFENNPYWCGKPFVFGTYTPINRSTSALGVIEPSLGLLHEFNILTNQRLDNLELSINSMWEYREDGTLPIEDIYSEPGKVFPVNEIGTLVPIQSSKDFMISYDEQSVLEQRIDKNAGTGQGISANASRDAERVTAAEIQAVRDAGGSRLSAVHKHVEETALIPALNKVFRLFQQFVTEDEIVRVAGENPGDYDFFAVGIEELQNDFILTPVGADHVADKEFELGKRLEFLTIASQNPEMAKHVNYYNFMLDLARRMGIDDIDQFIVEESPDMDMTMAQLQGGGQEGMPPGGQMGGQSPQNVYNSIKGEVGKPTADVIASNVNADGGQQLMQELLGVEGGQLPPDAMMQMAGQ
jgi:hypothetical protein